MEIKASATYLRIGPRKLRMLANGLRGLSPSSALENLNFNSQHGKVYLEKVIKQAVANAVNNFKLAKESLKIEKIEVGEGPRMKRIDKSHGARFDRGVIQKRTAHLSITLNDVGAIHESPAKKVINTKAKSRENPPSPIRRLAERRTQWDKK